MRKYATAEECAAKKQKMTVRHFGFTEKVYGVPFSTNRNNYTPTQLATVVNGAHSSVSSPKAGCHC